MVCWEGEVQDGWSFNLSKAFYEYAMINPGRYGAAFEIACAAIDNQLSGPRTSHAASPCLLWNDKTPPVDDAWLSKRGASGR